MLQRNLLYTGVTRGKRLVVLVGQKKAVAIAVRNISGRKRWSKLGEWLRPNLSLSRPMGLLG
jgi:exodeoxyribonuclease V alpha subunit